MKRDMDLIRKIMLAIENQPLEDGSDTKDNLPIEGYTQPEISHHIPLLKEAGFIDIDLNIPFEVFPRYNRVRITWQGYEFLEAIRDEARWEKVKEQMEKVGGFVVGVAQQVAIDLLKQSIQPPIR